MSQGSGPIEMLLSAGQLAAGAASLLDDRKSHKEQLEFTRKQHEREMNIAQKNYIDEMNFEKEAQFKQHLSDSERQLVQLNLDLVNAYKEGERDIFDQRNQQLNTIILSASIMIAASITLLIEGKGSSSPLDPLYYML